MAGSRALPDLIARIKVDSSGVDAAVNDLITSFGKAKLGMAAVAGIAAGAGIAIVAGINKAIDSYEALGEKVLAYQHIAGGTAEEDSRLIGTFAMLGVGADTAGSAMFKLSKAIELTPQKLTDLGVVISSNAQGNVDLNQTLLNLADAYNATQDQAKKNLLVFEAFGRAGKEMIPILERGSASLKQLESQVAITFTQDDLNRIREAKVQSAELDQQWQAMWDNLGKTFFPVKAGFIEGVDRMTGAEQMLDQAIANGTAVRAPAGRAQALQIAYYEKLYDANMKDKHALDLATQAIQDQTVANDLLTKSFDALLKDQDAELSAQDKIVSETNRVKESQDRITEAQIRARDADRAQAAAQEAANQAIKEYGYNSVQAQTAIDALNLAAIQNRAASDAVTQAIQDQRDEYVALARAQLDQYIAQETMNGGTRDATKEQEFLVGQLQQEIATLAPGSPLRAYLQQYLDELRSTPADILTKFHIDIYAGLASKGGSTTGFTAFAEGGRPPVGVPYWVGENGPELRIDDRPGTIIPNSASTTYNNYLTLHGAQAVNDPEGVRRMLQRMQLLGAAG